MRRASFEEMSCSIARSLEVIGEWWTLLILRDVFFGVTRFEELQARLGIARNILAKRLDTLVEHGVLERRCYDEARGRHDYVLTDKGKALWPVLVTIRQWGDEWIVGAGHAPIALVHNTSGERTTAAQSSAGKTMRDLVKAQAGAVGLRHSSVHEAKGTEDRAVLVVLPRDRARSTHTADVTAAWEADSTSEAKRVLYVAVTRAEQLCAIAVPEALADSVIKILADNAVPFTVEAI